MTNPGNAIGTNGAYGGRTSVNAFNDVLSGFSLGQAGILSGWGVSINDSQQLVLGGGTQVRDVAIAMDPNGNFTSVDNISGQPIALTLPAAPATGTRYDMVVAYVVNPPMGTKTVVDNPGACGLIVVDGGTGGMNASDADTRIREAITQDGAAGTTAYYVVLCEVMRQAGETVISPGKISSGKDLGLGFKFPIKSEDIDWPTMPFYAKVNDSYINYQIGLSGKTILSFQVPSGKYYVKFGVGFNAQSSSVEAEFRPWIVVDGVVKTGQYAAYRTYGSHYLEAVAIIEVTTPATIEGKVGTNGNCESAPGMVSLLAIPIA